jgi:hypothetical protein
VKAHFFVAAALACGGCASQQASSAATTAALAPVVRTGDANLTCPQIAEEAAGLSQRMGGTAPGPLGVAVDVARAGAAMLIPGAGLVIAGADALTEPERQRRAAEAAAAQNRWHYLNGLYIANDCMRPAAR